MSQMYGEKTSCTNIMLKMKCDSVDEREESTPKQNENSTLKNGKHLKSKQDFKFMRANMLEMHRRKMEDRESKKKACLQAENVAGINEICVQNRERRQKLLTLLTKQDDGGNETSAETDTEIETDTHHSDQASGRRVCYVVVDVKTQCEEDIGPTMNEMYGEKTSYTTKMLKMKCQIEDESEGSTPKENKNIAVKCIKNLKSEKDFKSMRAKMLEMHRRKMEDRESKKKSCLQADNVAGINKIREQELLDNFNQIIRSDQNDGGKRTPPETDTEIETDTDQAEAFSICYIVADGRDSECKEDIGPTLNEICGEKTSCKTKMLKMKCHSVEEREESTPKQNKNIALKFGKHLKSEEDFKSMRAKMLEMHRIKMEDRENKKRACLQVENV